MTYKNLKKFLYENQNNKSYIFDLMPRCIKSKIILAVGDGACNASSFLSSILNERGLSHSRYISCDELELKDRFLQNGNTIEIDNLCQNAEKLIRKSNKVIGTEELLFTLSLIVLESDYVILEISDELYESVVKKLTFIPHAILFCTPCDERNEKLIDLAPSGVAEIFALSQKENFDYISNIKSSGGTRVSYASQNKITVYKTNLFFTEIFYFSYLYRIPSIDLNNTLLASIAIDCARLLFESSRATIHKGIANAKLFGDIELYSISPNILFKLGNSNFALPQNAKYNVITSLEDFKAPTENTIFCGDRDFIEAVKNKLKK